MLYLKLENTIKFRITSEINPYVTIAFLANLVLFHKKEMHQTEIWRAINVT